jgi:hypothetical protein
MSLAVIVGVGFLLYLLWLGALLDPWPAAGIMGGVLAVLALVALVRARRWRRSYTVPGTAAVIDASLPPPGAVVGRCDMRLLVDAPGLRSVVVLHRDEGTPVHRWPRAGMVLPIDVAPRYLRNLRVRWSAVSTVPELGAAEHVPPAPGPAGHVPDGRDFDDDSLFPTFDFAPDLEPLTGTDAEPSHLVARHLYPTEKYRGEWRRHWARPVKELALGAAVALVIVRGWELSAYGYTVQPDRLPQHVLVGAGLWAVWFVWRCVAWQRARLALTTVRVLFVRGVFMRRASAVPIRDVGTISFGQSPLGRVFGYGWFRFASVGPLGPLWRVGDLPNPNDLYLQFTEESYAPEASEARRASA